MKTHELVEKCRGLSDKCLEIITVLNSHSKNRSDVEHYLKGILVRHGLLLRDAAYIVETNRPEYRSSAFVLFRVILEDVARAHYVLTGNPMEEALNKINGQAYQHEFDQKRLWAQILAAEVGDGGRGAESFTITDVDQQLNEFKTDPANTKYVENGKLKRFDIGQKNDALLYCLCRLDARAYLTYKRLSQFVHFSSLTYSAERNEEDQALDNVYMEFVIMKAEVMIEVLERHLTGWYTAQSSLT